MIAALPHSFVSVTPVVRSEQYESKSPPIDLSLGRGLRFSLSSSGRRLLRRGSARQSRVLRRRSSTRQSRQGRRSINSASRPQLRRSLRLILSYALSFCFDFGILGDRSRSPKGVINTKFSDV